MLGVTGIVNTFVPVFFGEEYEKVKILLPILGLLYIPMGMNYMTGRQYLVATNQQNKYTKFLIIGGIVNVLINFLLIPKFLSIGGAIGSVTGEFCILFLGTRYLAKTKQYDFKSFWKDIYKYCISGVIMLIVLLCAQIIMPINWLSLITLILIGVIVYGVMLIILKDSMVIELLNNIKVKILK